jgi:hypothetical protein
MSIRQYLSRLGIEPVNKTGRALLYHAPYRTDNHPSFAVDVQKNTWHDFATGEGASIIDLVMKVRNINFKEAVKYLSEQNDMTPVQTDHPITTGMEKDPGIVILKEKALNNPALIAYLRERGIDIPIAQKHCRELYYTAGDKRYFGIGFKNDKGGYEIRNKYFKGATSKDITTINGHVENVECFVFEGFIDYLSYLTLSKLENNMTGKVGRNASVLILNSVTNLKKAEEKVKDFLLKHSWIATFLDNDEAGRMTTKAIMNMCPNHLVLDKSAKYENFKDVNEYLIATNRSKQATKNTYHKSI